MRCRNCMAPLRFFALHNLFRPSYMLVNETRHTNFKSVPIERTNIMNFRKAYKDWRDYRNTVNELSRMSQRELNDLGISRGDIPFVARRPGK